MGNGIQAVNNTQQAQKHSSAERFLTTFAPLPTAGSIFIKGLVQGKGISDSGKNVSDHFASVSKENKENFKANLKTAAKTMDENPVMSFLLGGVFCLGIRGLNSLVND